MKTSIAKHLTIVSILGAICAPLAAGCAAPTDEQNPSPPVAAASENVAATSEALTLGPSQLLEEMAKGLIAWSVGKGASALFPDGGIDVNKLLADIDAQTRAAIMEEAMRQDQGAVDAAMGKLHDLDLEKAKIGQPNTRTAAEIYNDVIHDPTIALINPVRAKLGPDAKADVYKRAGIALYAGAVQMDANALMMAMLLAPDKAESHKVVLLDHLKTSIAHVRKTAQEGRQAEFDRRLAQIGRCYQYHEMIVHGKTDHFTKFVDSSSGGEWGKNDSYDLPTALGRCDVDRDGHYGRAEEATASALDTQYGLALAMADAWAEVVANLEGRPAKEVDKVIGLDFGGMYGWGNDGAGHAKFYTNPFTGGMGCPYSYDAVKLTGKYDVDYDLYQCVHKSNGTSEPFADFGGMFGTRDYREAIFSANNPVTNAASCPAGFTQYQVLGSDADRELFYCARPHVAGTPSDASKFGGAFSRVGGYVNPMSGTLACPTGFKPTQVWGSAGVSGWKVDQEIILCTKK